MSVTGKQKYGPGLLVYHSAPENQDCKDQTPRSNNIHLFIWISWITSCNIKLQGKQRKSYQNMLCSLLSKKEKKSLKIWKWTELFPLPSPTFQSHTWVSRAPSWLQSYHAVKNSLCWVTVSRKLLCPWRVYFGTFHSYSAWVERWLQKEADPNSKLSSAHKRTIEAAFLMLSWLRELSEGAFFSIFYSLMSKGLAEKERKNKEQMVKELGIWSSRKKIQSKICFYNITLGWIKMTYHSSNSPDCCRQRI